MVAGGLFHAFLLLGMVTSGAYGGAGRLSPGEILQRVDGVYQNLQSYQFVAQYQISLLENVRQDFTGEGDSRVPTGAEYSTGQTVTEYIEFAAFNPDKVRLWVKSSSASGQILVVGDGHRTWTSMPLQKQYTEKATSLSGKSDADLQALAEELKFIREYWSLLVGRFRDVSRFSSSATLGKDARLKVGGEKVDCYVIKWQTEQANDEMWVDQRNFTVWRLKQTPRAGAPAGTQRKADVTIDFIKADLNPRLDDSLFNFTPPEKSTKVELLRWPAEKTK